MATMAEQFLDELEREGPGTRRTLARVPEGRHDWKPHEKSMELGYLASLVATMPRWIGAIIRQDALDLAAAGRYQQPLIRAKAELLAAFDDALEEARQALRGAADDHLRTNWQLKVAGQVVSEQPRHLAIRDSVLNHHYHHRGQLTVYLRLNDQPVPALYGPSADEQRF